MMTVAMAAMGLLVTAWFALADVAPQEAHVAATLADAQSANFNTYRVAVIRHLNANPGATGTIADGSLTFSPGYVRHANWTNLIDSGQLYVYSTAAADPGLLNALYQKSGRSFLVGRAAGGGLINPASGATGIGLPAAIPNGSIVIVGK